MISMIDTVDENVLIDPIEERFGVEALAIVIINFEGTDIDGYDEMVRALAGSILILLY